MGNRSGNQRATTDEIISGDGSIGIGRSRSAAASWPLIRLLLSCGIGRGNLFDSFIAVNPSVRRSIPAPGLADDARYKAKRDARSDGGYTRNRRNFLYRGTPARNSSRVRVHVGGGMKSRNADVQKSVQFYRRDFTFQIRTYPRRNRV